MVKESYIPIVLIEDGHLFEENLKKSGKTEQWVEDTLHAKGAEQKNTLLLTVDASGKTNWIGKEETL